jgi:Tol biopolymer transport system component
LLVILGFGVNRLAREGGGVQAASPSSALLQGGSSGLLAYSRFYRGESHVMVVDPARPSRPRDLGRGRGPRWSADGTQLVFTDGIGRGGRGLSRVFLMNADGSGRRALPVPSPGSRRFEDWAPAWSPDGNRIAFTRTVWFPETEHTVCCPARSAIFVLDLVHGGLRRVSTLGDRELPAYVTWSPDGRRLAYLAGTGRSYLVGRFGVGCIGLRVSNADGTGHHHVLAAASRVQGLPDACVGVWYPAWSPDGHWIAFGRSTKPFGGGADLYLIAADGKHLRRLTHQPHSISGSPTWSADGRRIAFALGPLGGAGPGLGGPDQIRAVVVIDRDGGHRHTIVRVRGHLSGGPDWQRR